MSALGRRLKRLEEQSPPRPDDESALAVAWCDLHEAIVRGLGFSGASVYCSEATDLVIALAARIAAGGSTPSDRTAMAALPAEALAALNVSAERFVEIFATLRLSV